MENAPAHSASPWLEILAACLTGLAWLHWRLIRSGRLDDAPYPERGYWIIAALLLVAIGLVGHRKWAALPLAIGGSAAGAWLAIGTVMTVPWPVLPFNLAFGTLLFAPAFVTARYWRLLKWRGRGWW